MFGWASLACASGLSTRVWEPPCTSGIPSTWLDFRVKGGEARLVLKYDEGLRARDPTTHNRTRPLRVMAQSCVNTCPWNALARTHALIPAQTRPMTPRREGRWFVEARFTALDGAFRPRARLVLQNVYNWLCATCTARSNHSQSQPTYRKPDSPQRSQASCTSKLTVATKLRAPSSHQRRFKITGPRRHKTRQPDAQQATRCQNPTTAPNLDTLTPSGRRGFAICWLDPEHFRCTTHKIINAYRLCLG